MNFFTISSLSLLWIIIAIITFLALVKLKVRAPYGRHARKGWGFMIDNKIGWFMMELPALLLFPLLSTLGPTIKSNLDWLLILLWTLHYLNRTLIFPFKIKTKGKKMPISIVISAVFFNSINGLLNGYYIGFVEHSSNQIFYPTTLIGFTVFLVGLTINIKADNRLIALRKKSNGYQIPRGWLFEKVSCPNHFGEIIEWTGFAIIAMNLPAASFAIWTFCNLLPRALNHHSWYQETFEEYPKNRNAVIPYLI